MSAAGSRGCGHQPHLLSLESHGEVQGSTLPSEGFAASSDKVFYLVKMPRNILCLIVSVYICFV